MTPIFITFIEYENRYQPTYLLPEGKAENVICRATYLYHL